MKHYNKIDKFSRKIYKEIFDQEKKIAEAGKFSDQFYLRYKEIFNLDMSFIDKNKLNRYDILLSKILEQIDIPKNIVGGGIFLSVIIYFFGSFIRDIWISSENVSYGSDYYIFIYIIWIIAFISPTIGALSRKQNLKSIENIITKYKSNASKVLNIDVTEDEHNYLESRSLKVRLHELKSLKDDNIITQEEYEIKRKKIIDED